MGVRCGQVAVSATHQAFRRVVNFCPCPSAVFHTRRGERFGFDVDKWVGMLPRKRFDTWRNFVHAERLRRLAPSPRSAHVHRSRAWARRCIRFAGFPHPTWKAMGVCCGQVPANVTPQAFRSVVFFVHYRKRERPAQGGASGVDPMPLDQTLFDHPRPSTYGHRSLSL